MAQWYRERGSHGTSGVFNAGRDRHSGVRARSHRAQPAAAVCAAMECHHRTAIARRIGGADRVHGFARANAFDRNVRRKPGTAGCSARRRGLREATGSWRFSVLGAISSQCRQRCGCHTIVLEHQWQHEPQRHAGASCGHRQNSC